MRRINSLFNDNAELAALAGRADSLAVSQKFWRAVVPDPLKLFTQAGGIQHKRLTVYADNGAIAAKVKLSLPSLLIKLQKQGLEVTSIRVEVQVKSSPRKLAKQPRSISAQTSSRLRALAQELDGSALGEALARLARRS
ncbi:MAG TPA: DciA family protein [Methylophilaceae bacterium]|nr:DciA family protein [Methylophilaceae bacterium]